MKIHHHGLSHRIFAGLSLLGVLGGLFAPVPAFAGKCPSFNDVLPSVFGTDHERKVRFIKHEGLDRGDTSYVLNLLNRTPWLINQNSEPRSENRPSSLRFEQVGCEAVLSISSGFAFSMKIRNPTSRSIDIELPGTTGFIRLSFDNPNDLTMGNVTETIVMRVPPRCAPEGEQSPDRVTMSIKIEHETTYGTESGAGRDKNTIPLEIFKAFSDAQQKALTKSNSCSGVNARKAKPIESPSGGGYSRISYSDDMDGNRAPLAK